MNRLFVALTIPEEVIRKIFELRKSILLPNSKLNWEKPDKIHLTLKFIGDVSDEMVPMIIDKILFLENFGKISLSLTSFNFFPNGNNPKILYIGLSVNKIINRIVFELNEKLFELGINKEQKNFKSHLTLLRINNPVSDLFINNFRYFHIPEINFVAQEISLFKSKLTQVGSRYSKINKYNLR